MTDFIPSEFRAFWENLDEKQLMLLAEEIRKDLRKKTGIRKKREFEEKRKEFNKRTANW